MADAKQIRNQALSLVMLVAGMVMLAYASVPLYDLFCRVTGVGGTTQEAEAAPGAVAGDRVITVQFNAVTNPKLPWHFAPQQREITLPVGASGLAFYEAVNEGEQDVSGTATYNVTPLKVGQYFNKVECFCFTEQRLNAGQRVDMPVSFFIDPEFVNDPDMKDVTTITLSYTFFPMKEKNAMELSRLDD